MRNGARRTSNLEFQIDPAPAPDVVRTNWMKRSHGVGSLPVSREIDLIRNQSCPFVVNLGHPKFVEREGHHGKDTRSDGGVDDRKPRRETGKNLEQWIAIAKKAKLSKHGEIVKYLKADHGMTHGYANLVAHKTLQTDSWTDSGDELLAGQYAGAKADLRPIYEAIAKKVEAFGTDVELAPKKSYVSFRRSKQFAIVQPSTKTRVDVGINLKGFDPTQRLEASGSFNSMVSHRVRLTDPGDVDQELVDWLHQAYELS